MNIAHNHFLLGQRKAAVGCIDQHHRVEFHQIQQFVRKLMSGPVLSINLCIGQHPDNLCCRATVRVHHHHAALAGNKRHCCTTVIGRQRILLIVVHDKAGTETMNAA